MTSISIDQKDKRILFELSINARASISYIAKKVGLSKQVVKYRMDLLEKRGILEGYYVLINIAKLGYSYYRCFLNFRNVDPETEQEIVEYCVKNKSIMWVAQVDGDLDFIFVVNVKNAVEFQEVLGEMLNKYGQFFEEKYISIATSIHHYPHKFLLNIKADDEIIMGGPIQNLTLDKIDFQILEQLTINARRSLLDIGSKLKIHAKVVKYRIDQLVKKGIIIGYRAKFNHRILGYTHHKVNLHLTQVSKDIIQKLSEYIKSLPSSIYLTNAVGSTEMEFEVMVKNNQEFHDLMRDLRFKFSQYIKTYSTFIIYYEPYINYLPIN